MRYLSLAMASAIVGMNFGAPKDIHAAVGGGADTTSLVPNGNATSPKAVFEMWQRNRDKLNVVIPALKFQGASLPGALQALSDFSVKLDNEKRGVKITLEKAPD
jgi:hypothetical protein